MRDWPRVSFGVIALNGEPFVRYCLRGIYPYAHEILVVEGAVPGAAGVATADGHSRDGTLETLRDFKAREDVEDKVQIITREGFWSEKDAMSRAYAERATGDYLWQVDVDEFYRSEDMEAVLGMLGERPGIGAVSFNTVTFWGGLDYYVDGWYLRRGAGEYHRLFKWGPGYRYVSHRPPTVVDGAGRDTREGEWLRGDFMEGLGIRMHHYSLLLPKQVLEKCEYYSRAEWARRGGALDWAVGTYLGLERRYHLHNVEEYPGCLYRYRGEHPREARRMWDEVCAEGSGYERRGTEDIERLLDSRVYRAGRWVVMGLDVPSRRLREARVRGLGLVARATPGWVKRGIRRIVGGG